jgi:hypothetical protein
MKDTAVHICMDSEHLNWLQESARCMMMVDMVARCIGDEEMKIHTALEQF